MNLARQYLMTELAFLRAFLGWEVFLEQSFVFYMHGQQPPRGRGPTRLAFPPTLDIAKDWVIPEERQFISWEDPAKVGARASRFFREGRPYSAALRANQAVLKETFKIRNAIAHKSEKARSVFIEVARNRIGNVPPDITVGSFLCTNVVHAGATQTYFDLYVEKLELTASLIVPT